MVDLRQLLGMKKNPPATSASARLEVLSYVREAPGEKSHIHLRIDPDGSGLLLVNASRVMHLNASATFMARLALSETANPQAISEITRRFKVTKQQAEIDYTQFQNQLEKSSGQTACARSTIWIWMSSLLSAHDRPRLTGWIWR